MERSKKAWLERSKGLTDFKKIKAKEKKNIRETYMKKMKKKRTKNGI